MLCGEYREMLSFNSKNPEREFKLKKLPSISMMDLRNFVVLI